MGDSTLFWLVLPGPATGLGGLLLLLLVRRPADRLLETLLRVTGGIVMAASVFSLLVPALELGTVAATLLPLGLAFAAGAMIYVVVDEMHPEGRERGSEREATAGFVAGFVVMMPLDNALG